MADQDAARMLVQYLHPIVLGIVRRKLPRRAAEEDLVQEIFLKIFDLHPCEGVSGAAETEQALREIPKRSTPNL